MASEIEVIQVGTPGPPGAGITTAEKNALAPKASPTFTGTATIPTAAITTANVTTLNVSGVSSLNGDINLGNATADTITITGHIETTGSALTVAPGAQAGTGKTAVVLAGNDTSGVILLTTGTGAAIGEQVVVTFLSPRSNANYRVILEPGDSDAAPVQWYPNYTAFTTLGFEIRSTNAPASSSSHIIQYWIIG